MKRPYVVQSCSSARIVLMCVMFHLYGYSPLFAQRYGMTFGTVMELKSGHNAQSMITGDFNGDGTPDLFTCNGNELVCNYQTPSHSWRTVPLRIDNTIISAVACRCNADRYTDIILLTEDPPELQVYLGKQGNKLYLPWKHSMNGSFDLCIAEDINNDGIVDIILSGKKELGVTVFLGKGNGMFSADSAILFPEFSFSALAIADINGDGVNDIIAANWLSNELLIYTGFGKMKFSEPGVITVSGEPTLFTVARIDTDMNIDIVVTSSEKSSYEIYQGDGFGGFHLSQTVTHGGEPVQLAVADINGDGINDICILSQSGKTLCIDLTGNSGAGENKIVLTAGNTPKEFCFLRRDGTMLPDVAILDRATSTIRLLLNANTSTTAQTEPTFITGVLPTGILLADVNHDGSDDLLIANEGSASISLFLNNGRGSYTGQLSFPLSAPVKYLEYLSKNDSIAVIVCSHPRDGKISLMELNVHNLSRQLYTFPTNEHVGVLRVILDSLTHLLHVITLEQDNTSPQVAVVEFEQVTPTRFIERNITPLLPGVLTTAIMYDYNGDGHQDIISAMYEVHQQKERIYISTGTADGTFDSARVLLSFDERSGIPLLLWMSDINGDGQPDLIVHRGGSENLLAFSYSIGDTAFGQPVIRSKDPVSISSRDRFQIYDINNDGVQDIILENNLTKSIQLYLGKGGGVFSPFVRLASTERLGGFAVGHIAHDSIPELIVTDTVNGIVKIIPLQEQR